MSFRPIVWVLLLLSFAFASTGLADPLRINILDAQYTTSLSISRYQPYDGHTTNFSRTQVSPVPTSDSMNNPVTGQLSAEANAGLFGISVYTAAAGTNISGYDPLTLGSGASATSALWFSPLASQTTTINIQFSGWNQWYYSGGSVSLLDVTSGDEMWNYGWGGLPSGGAVPWVDTYGGDPRVTAALTLNTNFNASDIYKLTMNTGSGSNPPDVEHILIQLYGFEPIPEPSAFTLLGLGSLALAIVRRRK